jgi:2-polyprenyl-3-methyl-5-hydroxy-6-metoxy-1,4-benzoquinol methylase
LTTAAAPKQSRCHICGGDAVDLPLPHPHQSMLSDGRIVSRALAKMSCLTCGAAFHARETPNVEVHTIYDDEYQLAASSPKSDATRARAYCGWIRTASPPPRTILEVGCGSGRLLSEFLQIWPEANGYGIDPALPGNERSDGKIRLARGFIEDIPQDMGNFDLIVAVNVIEHTSHPRTFLDTLRSRLATNGQIIIVCPVAQSPNVELLFFDHLHSLTPHALQRASKRASLVVKEQSLAPREIGDFQMTVLDATGPGILQQNDQVFSDLHAKRQSYLERWSKLDEVLLDRSQSSSRLLAFGAGQTAALLRAYAPKTWARIDSLVLDDVREAWQLGRPIALYRETVQNAGDAVLIATSPHVQNAIAERLNRDGLRAITWNDLIPR